MKYEVVKYFTDATDDHFAYHTGDKFPRDGVEVSENRINDLLTGNNKRGVALIKAVEEKKPKTEETPKASTAKGRKKNV